MGFWGLFKRNPIKEIRYGTWGDLVHTHGMSVDELSQDIRCVEKLGEISGHPVNFLRIFSLRAVAKEGVTIKDWETFDQHPELLIFEGYLDGANNAHLERKERKGDKNV